MVTMPPSEPTPPVDPDNSPWESIKIVPFAKGSKLQVRTVRQPGESDSAWILRHKNLYLNACREMGVQNDLGETTPQVGNRW